MGSQGLLTPTQIGERCRSDGEFGLAIQYWTGGYRILIDGELTGITIVDGVIVDEVPDPSENVISLSGPTEIWTPMLQTTPPPLSNTVSVMVGHGLELDADSVALVAVSAGHRTIYRAVACTGVGGPRDSSGTDHTAGGNTTRQPASTCMSNSMATIIACTTRRPVMASRYCFSTRQVPMACSGDICSRTHGSPSGFDSLPMTYRSMASRCRPPVVDGGRSPTGFTVTFLRQVPTALSRALQLDRPAFMGCSVGGLLALDLALNHADDFRASIAVEGALKIGGDFDQLFGMSHPQVSGLAKARMMEGLCAPMSPTPYVKEISQVYSAGWPPVFLGDLWYYLVDYDIVDRAHEIDTTRCAVHILNGEYDYTGSVRKGLEAHQAIAGSTHTAMEGIGHFPMAENPELFLTYLKPILETLVSAPEGTTQ